MKNILSISVVLALLVLIPSVKACGFIAGLFTSKDVPLSYVGAISFKKPILEGDYTRIPLAFEGGKWLENSGRVLKKVRSSRYEFEIYFTAVTCLAGDQSTVNPEIKLKGLVPGKYQLIYRNPDYTTVRVGEIEI